MNYILSDNKAHNRLKPLTYTRPVCELRVGILTIKEKWEKRLGENISYQTESYLQKKYCLNIESNNVLINSQVLPTNKLVEDIINLESGEYLFKDDTIIAINTRELHTLDIEGCANLIGKEFVGKITSIEDTYDIFSLNEEEIKTDFDLICSNKKSAPLSSTVNHRGDYPIFIEEGAVVEFCTLNSSKGPIYIGKDAEIMEGVLVRGPLAMCEHSVLNMGAKVYGATTLGPYCKCGGELNNVVFQGYSNKAHDGFLGNAVIGEWCNIGADTNNSNLKNTYDQVKLWDYETERFKKTGLQFCGLIMGDHSKFGINTMLNTGTVIGVGCNIYGSDFPRNFVPSFSFGGAAGYSEHTLKKFFNTAKIVMSRRSKDLTNEEEEILNTVFTDSSKYRNFK
ncbi:glucose-1-phosphate thymidylyltransferase [Marinilabiliaceae bacterium JC040]|nr:glucose-1-phosphate thymidylyltransferase [Marinilabiliaceae bacterium JC040]